MTTLEKAKRFHKAIQRRWLETWDVSVGIGYTLKINLLGREARAYRALLNHEIEGITAQDLYAKIWLEGARFALELFDAVHGRNADEIH